MSKPINNDTFALQTENPLHVYMTAIKLALKPFYDDAVDKAWKKSPSFDQEYKQKNVVPKDFSTYNCLTLLRFLCDCFTVMYSHDNNYWDRQQVYLSRLPEEFDTLIAKAMVDKSLTDGLRFCIFTGNNMDTALKKRFDNQCLDLKQNLSDAKKAFLKEPNTQNKENYSLAYERVNALKDLQKLLKNVISPSWRSQFARDANKTGYSYVPYNSTWPAYLRFFTTDSTLNKSGMKPVPFCIAIEKFIDSFAAKISQMQFLSALNHPVADGYSYNEENILNDNFFDVKNSNVPYCMVRSIAELCSNPIFPFPQTFISSICGLGSDYLKYYKSHLDWYDWSLIVDQRNLELNDGNRKRFQERLHSWIETSGTNTSKLSKNYGIHKNSKFYTDNKIKVVSFANLYRLSLALGCSLGYLRLETDDPHDYKYDYKQDKVGNFNLQHRVIITRRDMQHDKLMDLMAITHADTSDWTDIPALNYLNLQDLEMAVAMKLKLLYAQGVLPPSQYYDEYTNYKKVISEAMRKGLKKDSLVITKILDSSFLAITRIKSKVSEQDIAGLNELLKDQYVLLPKTTYDEMIKLLKSSLNLCKKLSEKDDN